MIFHETTVAGAYVIEPEPHRDDRGYFARVFCREEFGGRGLETSVSQCNLSLNNRRGILRGLHFQENPHGEVKLVRCVSGAIFDVVLDLRPSSPTYLHHQGVVLSPENLKALYIPLGCAHGFQALENDSTVLYQMSHPYVPGAGRGVRWNDPAFAIEWPLPDPVMADRDASYPDYLPRG